MGLLVLIEPEIPTTRGIGRKRWVGYWNLPKSPDFFEAGLRSVSGQLLELLGATYSWTGKANSQFDQESLESSLSFLPTSAVLFLDQFEFNLVNEKISFYFQA